VQQHDITIAKAQPASVGVRGEPATDYIHELLIDYSN